MHILSVELTEGVLGSWYLSCKMHEDSIGDLAVKEGSGFDTDNHKNRWFVSGIRFLYCRSICTRLRR